MRVVILLILSLIVQLFPTPWVMGQLLEAAKDQIGVTRTYDPGYYGIEFPNGDIDRSRGVCIDVVIRALRDAYQYDLQEEVIGFMTDNSELFNETPDKNISHRRVRNVMVYMDHSQDFKRIERGSKALPGDIITWDLGGGVLHIGISDGEGFIVHNISRGARLEIPSENWVQLRHYRFKN